MIKHLLHRPIAVLMSFLALILLGVVVLRSIPISLMPDLPVPTLIVQIEYPNTNARDLESTVVRDVRNQLVQVSHLEDISSETRDNQAVVTLSFEAGSNTDLLFLEVNEKIDQMMGNLPRDLERPQVVKSNISDVPVFYLSVFPKDSSAGLDLELSDFARSVLKRRIEQLASVAFVDWTGYRLPQVVIKPDIDLLHSLSLSEKDLELALSGQQVDFGNVILEDGQYQYQLEFSSELNTVEEVESIYLRTGGQLLQLKDVADVSYESQPVRGLHLYNNSEAVLFTIRKQPDAQLFDLQVEFNTLIEQLRSDYTQLEFKITNDQSGLLRISMSNLGTSLAYGICFAFLVMFIFYREWHAPILIGVAIPVALIMTLLAFYMFSISINIISLSGLVLGVGLMVDNSIIIIENIRQYRLRGHSVKEACGRGAEEVIRPLISSALTTCSVFLPLVFLSGISGALFYDQAVSISVGLACSLMVGYFLLPVLISLGSRSEVKRVTRDRGDLFERTVDFCLRHKFLILGAFVGLLFLGGIVFMGLPKNAFPNITRDAILMEVDWNEPISIDESQRRLLQLLQEMPAEIKESNVLVGEKQFLLTDREQGIYEAEVLAYLHDDMFIDSVEGKILEFFKMQFPSAVLKTSPLANVFDRVFSNDRSALVAHIQSIENNIMPEVDNLVPMLNNIKSRGVQVPELPLQEEFVLTVRRHILESYGIEYATVINKLRTLFDQYKIGELRTGDQHIPINIIGSGKPIYNAIDQAFIYASEGALVPLSHFVVVSRKQTLKNITAGKGGEQYNVEFKSYSADLQHTIKSAVEMDGKHSVTFSGQYFDSLKTIRELLVIMGVSLFLLFLILAAQFESLTQPLIVLLTVPIGLVGSLLGLKLLGGDINIVALIGMIVTSGIVVNDAILKVDMINRARRDHTMVEAIHIGGRRRLKPIIMTSLTTMLALAPILFSMGLGAELQRPLAISVIFGLLFGTVASLYLIPVLYRTNPMTRK